MLEKYVQYLDLYEKRKLQYFEGQAHGMKLALVMIGVRFLDYWFISNWSGDKHYFSTLEDAESAAQKESGVIYIYDRKENVSSIEGKGVCQ